MDVRRKEVRVENGRQKRRRGWYEGMGYLHNRTGFRSKEEAPGWIQTLTSADVQRKAVRVENGRRKVEEGVGTEKGRRRRGLELGNGVLTGDANHRPSC